MKKLITVQTRAAILEAAWDLIAREGRVNVSQNEIAAAAGVSRQTVYFAFGTRTGLLVAMVRHRDAKSELLARLLQVAGEPRIDREQLLRLVGAWVDYLPEVYPVASLLDAAGITDPEAREAIEDRMVGQLLAGFIRRLAAMQENGLLPPGADPVRLAEQIWETTHLRAWRSLVVDRGWSQEEFKSSRIEVIRGLMGMRGED